MASLASSIVTEVLPAAPIKLAVAGSPATPPTRTKEFVSWHPGLAAWQLSYCQQQPSKLAVADQPITPSTITQYSVKMRWGHGAMPEDCSSSARDTTPFFLGQQSQFGPAACNQLRPLGSALANTLRSGRFCSWPPSHYEILCSAQACTLPWLW